MTASCCSRLEEVNGVIILRHLLNIFTYTAEPSSPFFQAAKVGNIKLRLRPFAHVDLLELCFFFLPREVTE